MIETQPSSAKHDLASLIVDPRVEEIMINGPHKAFVISGGVKSRVELGFEDDKQLRDCIAQLVSGAGRVLDSSSPLVDCRLPDGSRLNAVIAPLAPATMVTIRRFVLRERSLDDLVELRVLNEGAATFLRAAVRSGINLLISGGTSTGKTTLLSGLCACVEAGERIVTIEETRELYLDHAVDDVCPLECQVVPDGRVTMRDLARNALRMRPTRIIVGEVRGAEALDMLTAMTSGHEGSMCTLHADSPREALHKLHTYAMMSGEGLESNAVKEMIARAVQLVVFCKRGRDGEARHVEAIFEVTGVQSGIIGGHEIFLRRDGELRWTGARPQCEARLNERGYDLGRVFRAGAMASAFDRRPGW